MINHLTPLADELKPLVDELKADFDGQGVSDYVGQVIKNMKIAAKQLAVRRIDTWLGYGCYLPALERVFSAYSGESEDDFYTRTEYPINVVEAYTVKGDDLATLVAADAFWRMHRKTVPCDTTVWPLNEDQGMYIDLALFENRLRLDWNATP